VERGHLIATEASRRAALGRPAAAMAEYLRQHTVEAGHQVRAVSGREAAEAPGGSV